MYLRCRKILDLEDTRPNTTLISFTRQGAFLWPAAEAVSLIESTATISILPRYASNQVPTLFIAESKVAALGSQDLLDPSTQIMTGLIRPA